MKFGVYLEENLTPEWRRAYIDYRACKKSIKVVANRLGQTGDRARHGEQSGNGSPDSSDDNDHGPSAPAKRSPSNSLGRNGSASYQARSSPGQRRDGSSNVTSPRPTRASPHYGSTTSTPRQINSHVTNPPPLDIGEPHVHPSHPIAASAPVPRSPFLDPEAPRRRKPERTVTFSAQQSPSERPSAIPADEEVRQTDRTSSEDGLHPPGSDVPLNESAGPSRWATQSSTPRSTPRLKVSPGVLNTNIDFSAIRTPRSPKTGISPMTRGQRSFRSLTLPSPRIPSRFAPTFESLYDSLEEDEKAFFDLLDNQLDKVESFYSARETEATRRHHELRRQLQELAEHRKIYHEIYPDGTMDWELSIGKIIPGGAAEVVGLRAKAAKALRLRQSATSSPSSTGADGANGDATNGNPTGDGKPGPAKDDHKALREAIKADKDHTTYNPERYLKFKKELRVAVLEFYRQLELIKNYRILNLTGFRKALKKFEKTTKIQCLELYTDERIMKQTFSSGETIDRLIKEVEEGYSAHFEHGDFKRARNKLRRQDQSKEHYVSMFRSGVLIGVGLPAAIFGIVNALGPEAQAAIPAWDGLLQVYASLFIPVIFAMLFELNLAAWVSARINYEFVMELSKPVTDYRSFLEIPAFLFCTLSYCFSFTYYRVGSANVSPSSWPAAWLVFVAVFFLNPLPVMRRNARYWLLRVLYRVLTPGISKVEFIAFFLADELNSLSYSISNIMFLSCGYSKRWPSNIYGVCPSGSSWPYALLLCLPALSRFIQCVKRWYDSQLIIHLINAGKYLSTICQFCLFVTWRSRGSPYLDPAFFVWIFVAFISSSYTCTWDFVVDWSLFRRGSAGLRPDRGYSRTWVYYCAMVYNVMIRFAFIAYVPVPFRHTRTRSFFIALAEMLRRWSWNFFRVETEHLGNADAYRVTREIPLPYRRIGDDSSEDEHTSLMRSQSRRTARGQSLSAQLDRMRQSLSRRFSHHEQQAASPPGLAGILNHGSGRGPDELNLGPRGHAGQREYEARRPGDDDEESSEGGSGSLAGDLQGVRNEVALGNGSGTGERITPGSIAEQRAREEV